ncbi:MAG: hypothetical protein JJT94_04740 [Bernardetiaceae bacterium]|nr:hypothetical protein [Bernardetiaceae bacterium]
MIHLKWRFVLIYAILSFFQIEVSDIAANNLRLSETQLIDAHTLRLRVAWDNAWHNNAESRDAVWLFFKYRRFGGDWEHATLAQSGHSSSDEVLLEVSSDAKGIFVITPVGHTAVDTFIDIKLASALVVGEHSLKSLGIEMVWIPEAAFFIGDSVASQNAFREGIFALDSQAVYPYPIRSEAEIEVGKEAGLLYGNADDSHSPKGNITAAYPKGFRGFYAMKYEITQGQYVDFLNMLPFGAQKMRTQAPPDSPAGTAALAPRERLRFRNEIRITRAGGAFSQMPAIYEATIASHRACNFLSPADVLAYLDWAALRPMTEFEFEKICRGTASPQKGEFAWGTPFIIDANTLSQDATPQETVIEKADSISGLASFNSDLNAPQIEGPLRSGFGGRVDSDRLQLGAGFYGNAEMSGNLWEMCVTVTAEALNFVGNAGDGKLDADGHADAWDFTAPEQLLRPRGGAWNSFIFDVEEFRDLAISARFYADLISAARRNTTGGRGVRYP